MTWTCLVVDDDRRLLWSMEPLLREAGFLSAFVFDAETALHQAERLRFDVFLIDVCMPGMDGRQLCRELQARGHDGVRFLTSGALDKAQLLATVEEGDADCALAKTDEFARPDSSVSKPIACRRFHVLAGSWLRRLGRESRNLPAGTLQPVWLDFRRRVVFNDAGAAIDFSSRLQFDFVYALSLRLNETLSVDALSDQLYGGGLPGRRLDSLADRTRQTLRAGGSSIQIQHNQGWRLVLPEAYERQVLAARLDAGPRRPPIVDLVLQAGDALRSRKGLPN